MRVGLVLGAGGVLGGAWLTGGLHALAEETDWDPGSADFIVGTSAGSMIGALTRRRRAALVHGRPLAPASPSTGSTAADGRPAAEADRAAGAIFRLHRGLPAIGPGSLRMALTALSNPLAAHAAPAAGRLAARRARLDRLAQGHRPPRGPGPLGRPPELLGGGLRLRAAAAASPFGRARRAQRRHRRRGRRLVRDPRLLPPGQDRPAPLRRRRRLLRLQPRPASPGAASTW